MSDCFLKLDQIIGESGDADKELAGAIQVSKWQWGASWSGELRNQGSKSGPGEVSHFSFQQKLDNAASGLLGRCLNGQIIPKAVLTMRRAGGTAAQAYLKIQFDKVRIVSVDLVHESANEFPDTRVTFAFKEVSFRYTQQGNQGGDKSGAASFNHIVDA